MNRYLHDCVYLTASQFVLLSSSAGIRQVSGLFRKPVDGLSEESLHTSLAALCSRGLMRVDQAEGEAFFRTDPGISEIFSAIKGADFAAMFFKTGSTVPDLLGYIADTAVIAQVSEADENAVRLFVMPYRVFFDWLQEEGYLPEQADHNMFRRELEMAAKGQIVEVRSIDTGRYICSGIE